MCRVTVVSCSRSHPFIKMPVSTRTTLYDTATDATDDMLDGSPWARGSLSQVWVVEPTRAVSPVSADKPPSLCERARACLQHLSCDQRRARVNLNGWCCELDPCIALEASLALVLCRRERHALESMRTSNDGALPGLLQHGSSSVRSTDLWVIAARRDPRRTRL